MQNLDSIGERIRVEFDARTQERDRTLARARLLTRHSANAIRAIHRSEQSLAHENLAEARQLAAAMKSDLATYPDLYYAGYTQDALKEFCEASITCALIENQPLPTPEELSAEYATYLNGLAEVTGELRRRCLDILRQGYSQEAERLLSCMDDIYAILVTLDYPDAITNGLRRQTDLVRGIVERTRGDLTISLREQHLEQSLARLSAQLSVRDGDCAHPQGV
jgi:translin